MDDKDPTLLAKVAGGLVGALSAAYWWMWNMTHKKIDGKADKEAFDALAKRIEEHMITKALFEEHTKSDEHQLGALKEEALIQRGHIAKLFDRLEESTAETQVRFTQQDTAAHQRHIDLLNAIHEIAKKK